MAEAPPNPELSVVVPVMNEAENIAPLVREIVAALDGKAAFEWRGPRPERQRPDRRPAPKEHSPFAVLGEMRR